MRSGVSNNHFFCGTMDDNITFKTEQQLQAYCAQWFWNTYPAHRRMLVMVDNNSENEVIGNRKKAMGVVRGPSDLFLVLYRAVIFIEMKLPGKTQSVEQKDFENKVTERGHIYIIMYSFKQFKEFIWQVIGK